ncbi:hypothetical protein CEE39_02125 [bacterium (candidate division B38) B3_B38]|nr:MAG: hypothetical protein CEE39_02125 [bacterium (candidate division B38) B3_B38]
MVSILLSRVFRGCFITYLLLFTGLPLWCDELPLIKFPIPPSEIELQRGVQPNRFFDCAGRRAAVLGNENGVMEVWVYPFKIVHDLHLSFKLGAEVFPEGMSGFAERIIVRPESITIVYSHPAFTVRETIFVPVETSGAVILLDVDTSQPLRLMVSFVPDLKPMWPGGLGGQYCRWEEKVNAFLITESRRQYAAIVGSPLTDRFSRGPAHRLSGAPSWFEMELEQEFCRQHLIPIVIAGGMDGVDEVFRSYSHILKSIPELYQGNIAHYQQLRQEFLRVETPERELNLAFEWAKVALDRGLVSNPRLGCGLVAGLGPSGSSERPGFAWFFGGDTMLNSLAINSYGDFATVRQALALLRKYQREDGKIMHELSQSAFLIPWFEEYPYGYYHAETSPFYIISLYDYYSASGDHQFLTDSWNSLKKAYQYCLTTDTDGDGLMENSQAGLGAVEVGTLLKGIHQEIYLAGLWTEALRCMGELAGAMGERELKEECQSRFRRARRSLQEKFWAEDTNLYAFCIAQDGSLVKEATAWPAVPMVFNLFEEERASGVLAHLCSAAMSTDWGVRMLANTSQHYQPLAYNNGAVWPFITGYVSLAEYRYHRSVPALMHLMSIARLTFIDALGFVPELLSGEFYRTIEASVPHQLFSSGMVITPLVRGLLGMKGDAPRKVITLAPHLPPTWEEVKVRNFRVGDGVFSFDIRRVGDRFSLSVSGRASTPYKLVFSPAFPLGSVISGVSIGGKEAPFEAEPGSHDLHCRVEVELSQSRLVEIIYQQGVEIIPPPLKTSPGDRSTSLRIIDWSMEGDRFKVIVEGVKGVSYLLELATPFEVDSVSGGRLVKDEGNLKGVEVAFAAEGEERYQQKEVIIHFRRKGG